MNSNISISCPVHIIKVWLQWSRLSSISSGRWKNLKRRSKISRIRQTKRANLTCLSMKSSNSSIKISDNNMIILQDSISQGSSRARVIMSLHSCAIERDLPCMLITLWLCSLTSLSHNQTSDAIATTMKLFKERIALRVAATTIWRTSVSPWSEVDAGRARVLTVSG